MATTSTAKSQAESAVKSAKDGIAAGADTVAAGAEKVAAKARTAGRSAKREATKAEASLTSSAEDLVASVAQTLRSAGVDTDRMVDVAKEQATDLQRLIVQEIQDRPLRALGLAAAVGLFVGFLSAR